MTAWSPQEDRLISRLHQAAWSGSNIGRMLSPPRTRNAVIGRLYRLGFPKLTPAEKLMRQRVATRKCRASPPKAPAAVPRPPRPFRPKVVAVDLSHAKAWEDRRPGECAFPAFAMNGRWWSCCAPTKGIYCGPHQAVMYRAAPLAKGREPPQAFVHDGPRQRQA